MASESILDNWGVGVEGELAGEGQEECYQTNLNHELIIIESVLKMFLFI
jgi:hypothetical protein